MKLQEIREQLILALTIDLSNWEEVINSTCPSNFGIEEWAIAVPDEIFFVDIPNKTFKFKDVDFFAKLVLGASQGDSSFVQVYNKSSSGHGAFTFVDNNQKVTITDIHLEIDSNIYS